MLSHAAALAASALVLTACARPEPAEMSVNNAMAARAAACMQWSSAIADSVGKSFSEQDRGGYYDFIFENATAFKVLPNGECRGFHPAILDSDHLPGTQGLAVVRLEFVIARTRTFPDGTQAFIAAKGPVRLCCAGPERHA